MPTQKQDFHRLMFPPARAVVATMNEVERRSNLASELTFGIPEIDDRFNPLLPGELMVLLARPGMNKTISAIYLAKHWAQRVRKNIVNGRPQVIVYFTVETLVEQFMMVYTAGESGQSLASIGRGTADRTKIHIALANTIGQNLIVVGKSQEADEDDVHHPSMYDLGNVLKELKAQGFSVAGVVVDYIQFVGDEHNHFPTGKDRTACVEHNWGMCKALGQAHKTGFLVCAQARREVDAYGGLKFPMLDDGQWSSLLEQIADKVFSLTLPGKYMGEDVKVKLHGFEYEIQANTLGLKMVKQRFGVCDVSDVWLLNVNFASATMTLQSSIGEDVVDYQ